MTDSGSYQLSIYGELEVNNKQIVEFQRDIGSDIAFHLIFQHLLMFMDARRVWLEQTLSREKEALGIKKDMLLAAPVQGSSFPILRERAARELSQLDLMFIPLARPFLLWNHIGIVILWMLSFGKKGTLSCRARASFRGRTSMMFSLAVAWLRSFDSASMLYMPKTEDTWPYGHLSHRTSPYFSCSCPVCSSYNVRELIESERKEELLAAIISMWLLRRCGK